MTGCRGISSITATRSYLVIPNLYAADNSNEEEAAKALAMNHLAGVLTISSSCAGPTTKEGKALREEGRRQQHAPTSARSGASGARRRGWRRQGLPEHSNRPIRNHGLFSKAEHALQIAGWSEKARNDVEVFRLVDAEGLTPVLMVLNESGSSAGPAIAARPVVQTS